MEPTIDEIQRDTIELKSRVADVSAALTKLESLRDRVIADEGGGIGDLQALSALTTQTGQRILELSAPLASVKARTETLGRLAKEGRAAATSMEVAQTIEELEVCKLEVSTAVELVRGLAWEEIDGKNASRRRIELRIQRENPAMTADMIAASVRQAEAGARERVAQLDTLSGVTMVGSEYGKIDHEEEDLEAQPLRAESGGQSGTGGEEDWEKIKNNPGLVGNVRSNWKTYLVGSSRLGSRVLDAPL
ncbi:hypothetical protein RQP46_000611 [Phenoliferia psychrophenolica]